MEVYVLISELGVYGVYSSFEKALKEYEDSGLNIISSKNYIHKCTLDQRSLVSIVPLH